MSKSTIQTIGIDCRLSGLKHAGIGRYTQSLILHLLKQSTEDTISWVFFFYDKAQAKEVLQEFFTKKKSVNIKLVYIPIQHYSLSEQQKLPKIFEDEKLDLLHIPHFNIPLRYKGKIIVTIHDLLWHEQKGKNVTTLNSWKYWPKYMAYRYITSKAVHRAEKIIVPAETIKQTVTTYYPKTKDKIVITKEGVDAIYTTAFSYNDKPKKQFIYTGSLYPHKNISLVLQALKKLPEYSLIIVGSRNVFQDTVRKQVSDLGLHSQVHFAGYIPDKKLTEMYHQSFAFAQPSLSEGFGLPGLEALATGLPVLCSDIPIFKEIYANAALFFDPYEVHSFIDAVRSLEQVNRNERILLGKKIASQYDWNTMAEETLQAYKDIV